MRVELRTKDKPFVMGKIKSLFSAPVVPYLDTLFVAHAQKNWESMVEGRRLDEVIRTL